MRLIELNFAAIGPFPEEHRIRFADFESAGLFLLRGATGSGKSTIIDAVLFALYGEAAIKITSSSLRLRSNFARKEMNSYAELIFEVPSGIYRIQRSPAYVKAGNKNATAATAVLEKLVVVEDEVISREPLAAKPRDVNALIPEIVGIQADQFLQTVVLPQGKFAEFVRATPDARKQLLQQIFKTQHFNTFTEKLKEKARAARAQYEETSLRAQQLTATILGAENNLQDATVISVEVDSLLKNLKAEVSTQTALLHGTKTLLREAKFTYAEVSELKGLQAEFTLVEAEYASLNQRVAEMQELAETIELARQAQPVLSVAEAFEKAQTNLQSLHIRLEAECDYHLEETVNTAWESAEALLTEKTQTEATLTQQLAVIKQLNEKRQTLVNKVAEVAQLKATVSEQEQLLEMAAAPMEQQLKNITELEAEVTQLPLVAEQLTEFKNRLAFVDLADQKRKELVECAELIGTRVRQLESAKRESQVIWERWKENTAGALATQLKDGEACFVCGSVEHPALAMESNCEAVSTQQLAEVAEAENEAKLLLEKTQDKHVQLNTEIAELNKQAGAMRLHLEDGIAEREQLLRDLQAKEAAVLQAKSDYDAALAQLTEIRQQVSLAKVRSEEIQKTITSLEAEIATAEATTLGLSEVDLVAKTQSLSAEVTKLRALVNLLSQLQSLTEIASQTEAELQQALTESVFSSVNEAKQAVEAVEPLDEKLQLVASFHAKHAQVKTRFLELRSVLETVRELPDLEHLKTVISSLQEQQDNFYALQAEATAELKQVQNQAVQLDNLLAELSDLEARNGVVLRLSAFAAGAKTVTGVEIPLSTWVLMERFEAVIAAANPFIASFSGSRFKLVRVDDDANSQARHGGLGIAVYDSETDQQRPSKTLSGGETFYVSLALALGLAEVVSAEAGGIDFRSMLIDEGFGTLDPETLDKVLEGIKKINQSGRTVGIVSHVEELRRRISDGIEVFPRSEGGSTLRVYS